MNYKLLLGLVIGLLFSMTYVSAVSIAYSTNVTYSSNSTTTTEKNLGVVFRSAVNQQLTSISKNRISTSPTCMIIDDASEAIVAFANFTDTVCPINFAFVAGSTYRIVTNASNGPERVTSAGAVIPVIYNGIGNFTRGCFGGPSDNCVNNGGPTFYNIDNITFTDGVPGLTTELITPTNGATPITTAVLFNASGNPQAINLTNATLFIWNSSGLFNRTTNLVNGAMLNYSIWNVSGFSVGNYLWNALFCGSNATASICSFAPANFSFFYGLNITGESFNPSTVSGSQENFSLNVSLGSSGLQIVSANLYYNNTMYGGLITSNFNNYTLFRSLTVPSVTIPTNIPFFWSFTLDNGINLNYTNHTQSVSPFQIDNCTTYTNRILNFTLYDEDMRSPMNGTIELAVGFFSHPSGETIATFNRTYPILNGGPAQVCLGSLNGTARMDYQAKYYGNSSYFVEYKFGQHIFITNTTQVQNIGLYDLLVSSGTAYRITLSNPDLSLIQGAVIDVQRQYVPINQYISVEGPLTDVSGSATVHLVSKDVYYNFIVTQNGTILGTFNSQTAQCQNEITLDCRITLNLAQAVSTFPNFQNYGNISTNFLWSPSSRTLQFVFLSTDGATHLVAWNVIQSDNYANNTICINQATSSSGTFTCTVPTSYGNKSIIAKIYSDGLFLGSSTFSLDAFSSDIFGGTKIVLGVLMYTSLALLMISSPPMMIIGAIMGMGFVVAFHLADGGTFFGNGFILAWFIIAGIILIHYMRNKL